MSNKQMTYDEYLKRYSPARQKQLQREQKRKPFESDEALDRRLLLESLVRKARRLLRKTLGEL